MNFVLAFSDIPGADNRSTAGSDVFDDIPVRYQKTTVAPLRHVSRAREQVNGGHGFGGLRAAGPPRFRHAHQQGLSHTCLRGNGPAAGAPPVGVTNWRRSQCCLGDPADLPIPLAAPGHDGRRDARHHGQVHHQQHRLPACRPCPCHVMDSHPRPRRAPPTPCFPVTHPPAPCPVDAVARGGSRPVARVPAARGHGRLRAGRQCGR